MQGVNLRMLTGADRLIRSADLHAGEPPVAVAPLLDSYCVRWALTPPSVEAVTVRDREYVGMRFNTDLQEPQASARRRHAQAHELSHVLLKHRGDLWIMWRRDSEPDPFVEDLDGIQERQCELLSAYLLIPLQSLYNLRHESREFVAAALDVPPPLVELRWAIWRKFGK